MTDKDLAKARARLNAQWQDGGLSAIDDPPEERCPTCGGQGVIKVNPNANPGEDAFGQVEACRDDFHSDQRLKKLAKISNLSVVELEIRLAGCEVIHMPNELHELPFKLEDGTNLKLPKSNVDMLETFHELSKDPLSDAGMIYLMGPWGGGKTYAAMALVNEINLNSKGPAMYITLPDLVQFLKAAYDDRNRADEEFGDWSFDKRYEAVTSSKVIVVDEFDFSDSKVKGTAYNLELLQRWFNARYRSGINNQTLTVLVSNSLIEDMGLGGVSSRMSDGRFRTIFNTAPDMRPGQGVER